MPKCAACEHVSDNQVVTGGVVSWRFCIQDCHNFDNKMFPKVVVSPHPNGDNNELNREHKENKKTSGD